MSIGSESTFATVHSPAESRVARVPQISAHMSMNVCIRFRTAASGVPSFEENLMNAITSQKLLKSLDKGEIRGFLSTAAPSPLSLIVRKGAYHCQRNILPPAFRRCAAWAATIKGIVATHIGCQKTYSEVEMVPT